MQNTVIAVYWYINDWCFAAVQWGQTNSNKANAVEGEILRTPWSIEKVSNYQLLLVSVISWLLLMCKILLIKHFNVVSKSAGLQIYISNFATS